MAGLPPLRIGVSDFSVSGQMASLTGRFPYERSEAGSEATVTGTYVMVAQRKGRNWRIRAHLFKPVPEIS